ncbi:hypothetical protein ABZX93_24365 [Streptomyces sp. NPDC006632]|uniref:hypothetical protein n=1 Tax=Streptomyces sp. NPDC006632 TaxID=3157182 RepID=UPI0033BE0B9B
MSRIPGKSLAEAPGRHLRWTALAAAFALTAFGCSDGAHPEHEGSPASELCDGTLSTAAVQALHRLTGVERFTELTGTNAEGRPNQFSLDWTAAHLHNRETQLGQCEIWNAESEGSALLISMDFSAAQSVPTRKEIEATNQVRLGPRSRRSPVTFLPVGVSTHTEGESFADLYFKCRAHMKDGEIQYVHAGMLSPQRLKGDSQIKDRLTMLTSVSRRLAAKLGCEKEADLPAVVPDPEGT